MDVHPSSQSRSGEGKPRRSLVTGGAGFIGSHLVDTLRRRGDDVTVIDNLSTGRRGNLAQHAGEVRLIEANLRDAIVELEECGPFEEIYHLAAAVGVTRIIERPIESIETNVLDTAALLELASGHARRGAPLPATMVASSSEVYGKGVRSPFAEEDDCLYGPTSAVRWSYACSKALDEYLALSHGASRGLPVVVVRFFNTVGPRQVGEYGMVLPRFVERVLGGQAPIVFGDGRQSRCFCDVRDVAPALPRLLAGATAGGRVFNLGSDRPIAIGDLARLVIETLAGETDLQPRSISYDEAYGPGFEDLHQRVPDLTRVREAIGFEPSIALATTIRDLADSIRREGASGSVTAEAQLARSKISSS